MLYVEEYKDDDPTSIFRQRLYELSADEDENAVRIKLHFFNDRQKWLGAHTDPSILDGITWDDTTTLDGCDVFLRRDGYVLAGGMKRGDCAFGEGAERRYSEYQLQVGENGYSFRDHFVNAATGEEIEAVAGFQWHDLRRARWFQCMIDFPVEPGSTRLYTEHYVRVHDQGGVFGFTHGRNPAFELITSTVYDVLPRYVEMYGWDEVIPVARTEVGNICITGVQYDPLLFSAMALKGCEICVRQATGSNPVDDALISSRYNNYYTALVSNSVSPGNRYLPDAAGGRGVTQIITPNGVPMAKAWGPFEEIVRARIPLASYRSGHRLPDWQMELYRPVFDAYRANFAPGEYLKGLPETIQDAAKRFYGAGRWG